MTGLRHSGIVQNCYVVRDIEAACTRLNQLYDFGPFILRAPMELSGHHYRGEAAEPIRMRAAFTQSEGLNIELVQLLSGSQNAFRDVFPDGGDGFHHVAMFCADYAGVRDRFVRNGFNVASEFDLVMNESKICFIDTREAVGHMTELYPDHSSIRNFYDEVREVCAKWDGKELFMAR